MKQPAQFVAVLVIVLLAVTPAFTGLPCVVATRTACAPGCPMAMNGICSDCPMSRQMGASQCPCNCCSQTLPETFTLSASPQKLHPGALASPLVIGVTIPAAIRTFAAPAAVEGRASPPPLYLVNRVFRI